MAVVTQAMQDNVTELYIGFFGRAPDAAGFGYWTNRLAVGDVTIQQISKAFAATPEFVSNYAGLTPTQQVAKVYQNVLGRAPDAAGGAYWVNQITSGVQTIADVVWNVTNSAFLQQGTADGLLVQNKVTVGEYFAITLASNDTALANTAYVTVTSAASSVATAEAALFNGSAKQYSLTTGVDTINVQAGHNAITGIVALDSDGAAAASTTYQVFDTINGSAGATDKLDLTVTGGTTDLTDAISLAAANVTGVETVSVRNASDVGAAIQYNASGVGATLLVNNISTGALTLQNIGAADVSIVGNNSSTIGATTVTVGGTKVTDAFVLNFAGGTKGTPNVYVDDSNAAWTAATINSTGAVANTTGAINLSGAQATASTHTVKTLAINAGVALSTGNIAGFDTTASVVNTITIAGAAVATSSNTGVSIGTLADAVDVVDASGLTAGGLTLTLSGTDGVSNLVVKGGAGQDKITTASTALSTGASISGGASDNDLLIVGASNQITSTLGKYYSNFEIAQINNGVTLDVTNLSDGNAIAKVYVNAGTDAAVVSNLSAAQALEVTAIAAGGTDGTATIGVKNATQVGQIDTVKITFDDLSSTVNTISFTTSTGALVLDGVENLVLNASADKSSVILGTDAAALTSVTLTGAQTQSLAYAAGYTFNSNTSIDGSASTGALTISNNAVTDSTVAVSIKGGQAADTLNVWAGTATDASDGVSTVVNAKDGLDTITEYYGASNSDVAASDYTVTFKLQSDVVSTVNSDLLKWSGYDLTDAITTGVVSSDSTWTYNYTANLVNGTGNNNNGIASANVVSGTTFQNALADAGAGNAIVFRATNSLATSGTALSTVVSGFTVDNLNGFVTGLLATGGSLNGPIAGLDTILGTNDVALLVMDDGTNSVVLRITNTDQATANTLTYNEIQVVGVVNNVNDLGSGGALGTFA